MGIRGFFYEMKDRVWVPVALVGMKVGVTVYRSLVYVVAFFKAVYIVCRVAPWQKIIPEAMVILWATILLFFALFTSCTLGMCVMIVAEIGMTIAIARLLSRAKDGEL